MDAQTRLLIVDDDREIRTLLSDYLTDQNFHVTALEDGTDVAHHLSTGAFDLLILDLMLPGEDGLEICRRVRASHSIPIIILTAKGEDLDRIIGIEMGADDYMAKPFNPRELVARIKAVLRRTTASETAARQEDSILEFEGNRVNYGIRQLLDADGNEIELSSKEFELLNVLTNNARQVMSRDELIRLVQGDSPGPEDRSIDMLVARLRKKIEKDPKKPQLIKTIRGTGYIFTATVNAV